ncbi:MAG: trehalose-phosphatase [Actinomycetota bacterium]
MDLDRTIAALRAEPDATGFFLDFDGTLARVVPEPAAACIVPGGSHALEALAARYRIVAMISGRAASDLHSRVGADGPRYFGLYGAEEMHDSRLIQAPMAAEWRRGARRLADEAGRFIEESGLDGCEVEYKDLAVSIHYRRRPELDPPAQLYGWAQRRAAQLDFRVGVGRKVLELKPRSVSKAVAFERLAAQSLVRNAVVAGDDSADVEMMRAASGLIHGCLLRVGIVSSESPEGMDDNTELQVGSPEELVALLRRFL